ncbi:MAG: hypothetical protein EVA26_08420 [Burkholderiaceae bacterium]|nr:MAG: hypothetical protein EVA26_08420 [Burkholderiaceae bacterium]|tara:strand:+ start:257 stop:937 length:681 start_codon:yes stop_codon:yes gene_type:complete
MNIVNEAVHLEHKWIFIAIPKTGTTSIRTQLRQIGKPLIPNPHLDILQVRDAIDFFFLKKNLATNKSFPSVEVKTYSQIKIDSASFFSNAFKFSSVRNPWERAVSLFFRKEGVQEQQNLSFDQFIENHLYASDTCVHPTLHKNQLDWICDDSGKILLDYIFKLENFSNAIKDIFERTNGLIRLENTVANKNESSKSSEYRNLYSEKTKKMIAKRFEKDIDTFCFTF